MFVTSQGSAHGRFNRFVQQRNVSQAESAAREMGRLSLADALSLVALYARTGSHKFEPAAVRWLARLAVERPDTRLPDLQLALGAIAQLRDARSDRAERVLLSLL